jgi:hypothetical protein
MWVETAKSRCAASNVSSALTSSLPSSGRVAPAVKVGVSFHPLSVRTLGTQAVVIQPGAIAKLTEQLGRPGRRSNGGTERHVQAQLIGHGERYE